MMNVTPNIAPFLLVRVSGVSPADLQSLCLPATSAAIKATHAAEEQLAHLAPTAEESLFRLIPGLSHDRALRRAALALKRDIHNGRTLCVTINGAEALLQCMAPHEREALQGVLRLAGERDEAMRAATESLRAELTDAGSRMVEVLRSPDMQQALALASPDFLESIVRGRETAAKCGTRFARSCFAYLTRAAVKTSPFSTFTKIGIARFRTDPSERPLGLPPTTTVANPVALATSLLFLCVQDPELAPAFQFEPNASLTCVGTRWRMLLPDYLCEDGFFYRDDRLVDTSAYAAWNQLLSRMGRSSYRAYLEAVARPDADLIIRRLLTLGILRPVSPWTRSEPVPLLRLAEAIAALEQPRAVQIAEKIRALQALLHDAGTHDPGKRIEALAAIRTRVADIFATLGQPSPRWLAEAGMLYEDVANPGETPDLGLHVEADLRQLGELMRPHMIRTRVYDLLCNQFVERYGPSGQCSDVLGFLMSFQAQPGVADLMSRALADDMEALGRPRDPASQQPVGVGSAPPAVTVFFQVAAGSHSAILKGDYLLVVNQYNPGHGGLMARFLPLLNSVSELRGELQKWLGEMHGDARIAGFSAGADWNSLQGSGAELFGTLDWPTECPAINQSLRFQDLVLKHDAERQTLSLYTSAGEPLAPVYLGVIPHYLFSGVLRLFFTLIDPWINGNRVGWMPRPFTQSPSPPVEVEHHPRAMHGRIVLRRARWRVPTRSFPFQQPGETDVAYLLRVDDWRSGHAIPSECFVRLERAHHVLDARRRKPVWLHFGSLHALSVLRQSIEETVTAISLIEALPSGEQHWFPGPDGLPRASEFLALLRWPHT